MKKRYVAVALALLVVITIGLVGVYLAGLTQHLTPSPSPTPPPESTNPTASPTSSQQPTPIPSNHPELYSYTVVNTYPHDSNAFTEGLVFTDGVLYESTGLNGASSLRRVNLLTGSIEQEVNLPEQFFGEGIAVVNNSIIQLTWQSGIGFVYDKNTFTLKGNFSIRGEGWGLTFDGSRLILSNGSSTLTFLDPTTFQPVGTINVKENNTPITNLNELEYINGDVYANVWLQQKIVIINPQNGEVKGYIDLSGIYQPHSSDDVLNGIAYDQTAGRLFVTGKNWPSLFQITIKPKLNC